MSKKYRPELTEPMPSGIKKLPVHRGYPVPWFVAWVDMPAGYEGELPYGGKPGMIPEFRLSSAEKPIIACNQNRCWVCGEKMNTVEGFTFVIGPMCGINRISVEPSSHHDCAVWSAINCPFLSKPNMVRRENDIPVSAAPPPGIMIKANPGVTLIWTTKTFNLEYDESYRASVRHPLFRLGDPLKVEWYAEGKPATLQQVEVAIAKGLPNLEKHIQEESEREMLAIGLQVLKNYFPKD